MLFWRNSAFIAIRIVQCTFMGFAVGTLFLQESKQTLEDAQMFMSVLFFSTMTQVLKPSPRAPSCWGHPCSTRRRRLLSCYA